MSASSDAELPTGREVTGDVGSGEAVFRVKISLLPVSRPPVWRRLLVPADIRLDRFHEVIQASMGWYDSHLHVFTNGSAEYGHRDPELGHRDERKVRLHQLVERTGDRLRYTYDFGDDWEHEIELEDVLAADPGRSYPACTAGKGACPPEDCGGPWGYQHLREVLADPVHEEHDDMLEWLGLNAAAEFDPASFDVDEVNEALSLLTSTSRMTA